MCGRPAARHTRPRSYIERSTGFHHHLKRGPVTAPEPVDDRVLSTILWTAVERRVVASIVVSLPEWWIESHRTDPLLASEVRSVAITALEDLRDSGADPSDIHPDVRRIIDAILDSVFALTPDDVADEAIAAVIGAAEYINGERIPPPTRWEMRSSETPITDLAKWQAQLEEERPTLGSITQSEPPSRRPRTSHPADLFARSSAEQSA